jgi:hypothetical protein
MASCLLEQPVSVRSFAADIRTAELIVERTDIQFRNSAPGHVQISVNVTNIGQARSLPTTMQLQAAPLGAFVPWRDLKTVIVPSIEPGDSIEVVTEVSAGRAKPLGQFSRVPPRKLLTALGSQDEPQPQPKPATGWGQFFGRMRRGNSAKESQPTLPGDPFNLLSRPNMHWAGNINILIGRHAVERHLAQALRIYPGRTNLAAFIVGDKSDDYQFEVTGSGASWDVALFNYTTVSNLQAIFDQSQPIPRSKWIRLNRFQVIMLAIGPPEGCGTGSVNVQVRQRSTNRDAIVEFSLDPDAAGAGCYTI